MGCISYSDIGRLGVSINGVSDSFLLTCGGISNWWIGTQKLLGVDRSAQTRQVHIKSHTPAYTTESNLQSVI